MKEQTGQTHQGLIYEKLWIEYNGFLEKLREMQPQQIIDHAYEMVIKKSILNYFEDRNAVTAEDATILKDLNYTLKDFYSDWVELDAPFKETIKLCIDYRLEKLKDRDAKVDIDILDATPRKFMDINITAFISEISKKVIIHYPNDVEIDKETLNQIANSPDGIGTKLGWHVCSTGTHSLNFREMFVKDTYEHNCWTDYHQNDPDMFGYIIEVEGMKNGSVYGNVFEVGNYAEHAKYVKETAMELHAVTLNYTSDWGVNAGKSLTVSRQEYDNERNRLCSQSGHVRNLLYHPADENQLAKLLVNEYHKLVSKQTGSPQAHIIQLTSKIKIIRDVQKAPTKKLSFDEQFKAAEQKANKRNAASKQEPSKSTKNKNMEIGE